MTSLPLVLVAALAFASGDSLARVSFGHVLADSICFDGEIGAGPRTRRLILVLPKGRDGTTGTAWLYGRPVRSLPLEVVASAGSIRAAAADTSARFTLSGTWAADATELHTTVTRSSDTSAVRLRRSTGASAEAWAVGDWSGVITANGIPLRLGVRVERGPCGLLVGVLDSPDQGQNDLPLTAVTATPDSLVVAASYLGASLTIARRDGEDHPAVFVNAGQRLAFSVRRGVRVTESRRPQDPVRPFPYDEREARFENRTAGVRFTGTLTLPRGTGPHPAVLLVSGSGAQDRDETVAGHRPFLVLSDFLTRRGYAVLRVDDRGAGGSTGHVLAAGLDDLSGDVAAGLEWLRAQPEIDRRRIGLVGHSEGGYVAPIVAARDSGVSFLVLLAAPAARGRDLLIAQRAALARADGTPPDDVTLDSLLLSRIFDVLDTRPSDRELESRIDAGVSSWLVGLRPDRRARAEAILRARTPAQDSASFALWKSAWFRSVYHHDPQPVLERVRVPVLAVYGELDLQVPPAQSVPALVAALGAERGRLTVVRLPGVNHLLQTATTGLMTEYVRIEETIAPGVLEAIGGWLGTTIPGNQREHR